MTQLVAEKLVKAYGQRTVVQNVDFEASRGEIVGLLGPNGAGKTTTFGLIIGLGKPKSGRIFLDGRDITELPMHKRTRLGLGYLPQEPSVFRKLTVEENVQECSNCVETYPDEQAHRLADLMEEFNLREVRHQKGYQLSGASVAVLK